MALGVALLACNGFAEEPPQPPGASGAGQEAPATETAAPPTQKPLSGVSSGRNLIMGTGEPLDPRPFTAEDRLLDAVRRGDGAAVRRAVALGVAVESADALGRSALLLAVRDAGDLALARWLHEQGADPDRADAGGRTPLSFAAGAGRLDLVSFLLERGARLDAPDGRGRTPLFHAVLRDRRETIAALLAAGADVDVTDRFHDTPLMLACAKGFDATARLLLEAGADRAIRDQEGRTAAERSAATAPSCRPGGSHGA